MIPFMSRNILIFIVIMAMIRLGSQAVMAKPSPSTTKDTIDPGPGSLKAMAISQRRKAKAVFELAKRAYYLGRFKEASQLFSQAYQLLPLPEFLLNLGQCHRMMGDCSKAIFYYRGYLATSSGRGRVLVLRFIEICEAQLAALQRKKEAQTALARKKELARKNAKALAARKTPETALHLKLRQPLKIAQPRQFLPDPRRRKKEEVVFYKKWWFWTSVAVGVAAIAATGLALGLSQRGTTLPSGTLGTLDAR